MMPEETSQTQGLETPLEQAGRDEARAETARGQDARDEREADVLVGDINSYVADPDPASLPEAEDALNAWEIPVDPLEAGAAPAGEREGRWWPSSRCRRRPRPPSYAGCWRPRASRRRWTACRPGLWAMSSRPVRTAGATSWFPPARPTRRGAILQRRAGERRGERPDGKQRKDKNGHENCNRGGDGGGRAAVRPGGHVAPSAQEHPCRPTRARRHRARNRPGQSRPRRPARPMATSPSTLTARSASRRRCRQARTNPCTSGTPRGRP